MIVQGEYGKITDIRGRKVCFLSAQMGNVRLFMILTAMANADIIKPLERLVNPGVAV